MPVLLATFTNFNPLPRKEGDQFCRAITEKYPISIHSLVKRRRSSENQVQQIPYFNPLPRKEETEVGKFVLETSSFQSTPRKRET